MLPFLGRSGHCLWRWKRFRVVLPLLGFAALAIGDVVFWVRIYSKLGADPIPESFSLCAGSALFVEYVFMSVFLMISVYPLI